MPVALLTAEQAVAFGGEPTPAQHGRYFHVDGNDLDFGQQRKGRPSMNHSEATIIESPTSRRPVAAGKMRQLVLLVIVVVGLASCRSEKDGSSAATTVTPGEATFTLFVSNQSNQNSRVFISVAIDDRRVIAQNFDVGDHHNFVQFPLSVAPGQRELTASADDGTRVKAAFTVPENDRRWAVLVYGPTTERSAEFTLNVLDEPPRFA